MNHYSLTPKILPNITSCITSDYINNYNNEAYIDAFFTYLGSKLTETRRCPTFPLFYGTYNCLSNNLFVSELTCSSDHSGCLTCSNSWTISSSVRGLSW